MLLEPIHSTPPASLKGRYTVQHIDGDLEAFDDWRMIPIPVTQVGGRDSGLLVEGAVYEPLKTGCQAELRLRTGAVLQSTEVPRQKEQCEQSPGSQRVCVGE